MRSNLQSIQEKRQEFRIRIRKQELDQRQKKRMIENIKKLQAYILRQSCQIDYKMQLIYSKLSQYQRPPKPYTLDAIVPFFSKFISYISQPSNNEISISVLDVLSNFMAVNSSKCSVQILEFIYQFASNYKYQELFAYNNFRISFLNLLEKVCNVNEDYEDFQTEQKESLQKLRQGMLDWCRGTNSLAILTGCFSQVLDPTKYSHIYKIIQNGLGSQNQQDCKDAILAFLQLIDSVDYDESKCIQQQHPDLVNKLISRSQQICHPCHQMFIDSIIKLMNTYDQQILSLARMGIVNILIGIFESQRESYVNGLMILNNLVYVRMDEMGRLLNGKQLNQTWNKVASLYCSQKRQQQILVYSIFSGFFNSYDQQTIHHLLKTIDVHNTIFNLFQKSFSNLKDNQIVQRGVQMVRTLLYYFKQNGLGVVVLKQILKRQFVPAIENIFYQKQGKMSKLAGEILQIVEYSGFQQQQQCY